MLHTKLIENASRYIGTHHGTANGDILITKWLANFGLPLKIGGSYNPYCAAFVMSCIEETGKSKIFKSARCLDIWNKTSSKMRVEKPFKGCVFVWDFGNGTGHVGFVNQVNIGRMSTIEGNTKNPAIATNDSERNGGWVISRDRSCKIGMIGDIKLLGFIDPFID